MINRLSPNTRIAVRETLRRVDRIAGDLNVLLIVVAIGLATLDFTFLVTQKVIDSLPPVTRVVYDDSPFKAHQTQTEAPAPAPPAATR